MKKTLLLIGLGVLFGGLLIISCGRVSKPVSHPALDAFARLFTATVNNNSIEAVTYFSDNCTPSKETYAQSFFRESIDTHSAKHTISSPWAKI